MEYHYGKITEISLNQVGFKDKAAHAVKYHGLDLDKDCNNNGRIHGPNFFWSDKLKRLFKVYDFYIDNNTYCEIYGVNRTTFNYRTSLNSLYISMEDALEDIVMKGCSSMVE